MKATQIDLNIELLAIVLKSQEISSRWLIEVDLLNKGLKMTVMSLK